jgi:predicted dehydrogenase
MKEACVVAVADRDSDRLATVCDLFPQVRGYLNYQEIFPEVDAVIVATPTKTHFAVVLDSLTAGKHVLCEKPLCLEPAEGEQLVELARQKRLVLMVGHIFLFNAGLLKVKELIASGEIGAVRYLAAVRTNLGPVRSDVNAAYDLASHDISIFNWLLDAEPIDVRAMGAAFVQPGIEDVVIAALKYPNNIMASIQCTWDDLALSNPVAVYEKSIETDQKATDYGEFLRLSMLDGDVWLPKVRPDEPLRQQNRAFLASIRSRSATVSDGNFALGVVRVLASIRAELLQQRSL